ncbi:phosphotransferase [Streptomyces niveiscabiei]|uniref:phosphotransferase n=1 Tax=Streptomyces niveiscabiei TaxID=164115 RepID=UPI0029B0AD31|nr:phosphotransferase [Streptomyces niveiscabiei]MDX3386184.1 phosphotransferase [Streptomyces niveiscabiei]
MKTTTLASSPNPPGIADVFVYAATHIHEAAGALWPGERIVLESHVPSVTGYVHRVRVDDRALYAKTSFLGMSLVSLLCGAGGPWPVVRQAQQAYQDRPGSLPAREAAQLRLLAAMAAPRVCALAGLKSGVVFTEPVSGPSSGDLLLAQPDDTSGLLSRVFAELHPIHQPDTAGRLAPAWDIGERGIASTFLRKFNGLSGQAYIALLGAERREHGAREEVVELIHRSVGRLRQLHMALPPATGTTLVYGDLKPEHVLFPDGPGERPVLLDPGLLRADVMVDLAKLISRTVLFLATIRPGPSAAQRIATGLDDFVRRQAKEHARLRHVLTLWLMDTVNIVTTYLSEPADLPLPSPALALIERAVPVCSLVADLASEATRNDTWERALTGVVAVAS